MKLRLTAFVFAATSLVAGSAWADKIAVLPFTSPNNVPRPELDEARKWTDDALVMKGHTFATPDEMVQAMATVRDGVPDTSTEYIAAGNAVQAQWTLVGHVQREDIPPSTLPNGTTEDGYTTYRLELEACLVATGRVESLTREILAADEPAIAEMLALLIRPEGLANADIPWEHPGTPRPKPAKKVAPPPPPPPPQTGPLESNQELRRKIYGVSAPLVVGGTIGVNGVIAAPSRTRGSSTAAPLGLAVGWAFPESAPGLELRAYFSGQVAGPSAYVIDGGARYGIAPFRNSTFFVGPEAVIGAFLTEGAEKTGRFYADASLFAAYEVYELFQFEVAGDLGVAAGGSGSLGLAGLTFRALIRF